MSFDELKQRGEWAPIRGCPGRYVLRGGPTTLEPRELVGPGCDLNEFRVDAAPDIVVVARFAGGGLISYRKEGGTYVHTLNTEEGFERKLSQFGVSLS